MNGVRRLAASIAFASLLVAGAARAQTAQFTATVTAENADLRSQAAAGASIIDHVFKGAKLAAYGLSPDKQWVRVKGPSGTAWIQRTMVAVTRGAPKEDEGESAAAAPTPTPTPRSAGGNRPNGGTRPTPNSNEGGPGLNGPRKFAYVNVPKTNVLLNANDSSPTLAVANRNETFEVHGFSRDKTYVKVSTEDGRIGWIAKSDLHPGKPEVASAPREKTPPRHRPEPEETPRPRPTPEENFRPRRSSRMASSSEGDTKIWADGGMLLFHEKMTSDQGYGYDLNGTGFGAGVRFEHRISGGFGIEGGYLGMVNQRLPAKAANTSVSSSTHRLDFAARYKYEFSDEEGPSVTVLAGFQNVTFYVQPQSLDFFYSQVYNSGMVGLGGEYGFGQIRFSADGRYFVPVLAGERYGSGAKGADGQSVKSAGLGYGLGVRYVMYSGAQIGLNVRAYNYASAWSGTGIRGIANPTGPGVATVKVTGVQVIDQFDTVTLTFARGF